MTITAAAKLMTKARTSLVLTQPFFGALSLRLRLVEDPGIPTCTVDGKRLRYNPTFVQGLPFPELVGVVAHEVMHCALGHHARRQGRDPYLWNVACDYAINPLILAAGLQLPAQVLDGSPYAGKSCEEIFVAIAGRGRRRQARVKPDDDQQQPQQPDDTSDAQGAPPDVDASGDDLSLPDDAFTDDVGACGSISDPTDEQGRALSQPDVIREQQEWVVAGAQAVAVAKRAGNVPGSVVELFDQLREPHVDWREQLRRFVSATAKQDYRWTPPNRRHVSAGIYLPSVVNEGIGEIVFAIDTSASMDSDALQCALDEFNAILQDVEPERVHVVQCDTQINHTAEFTAHDYPIKIEAHGRGGTRFRPVFEWIEQQEIIPAAVIYFTDLGSYDFGAEPDYPVLWATANACGTVAPWGEVITVLD